MLNVIHSRQKRERRRAEADDVQQQCKVLEDKNDDLKKDNHRLEGILADAHRKVTLIEQGLEGSSATTAPLPASQDQSLSPNYSTDVFQQIATGPELLDPFRTGLAWELPALGATGTSTQAPGCGAGRGSNPVAIQEQKWL